MAGTADVQAELQDYLNAKGINNLFIKIVEALLLEKPDNPVQFIVKFLHENYPDEFGDKGGAGGVAAMFMGQKTADAADDDDDDDDEDDDDVMDMADMPQRPIGKKERRVSVSAESLDPTVARKRYLENRKVHPKTEEAANRIKTILRKNILFKGLDADQMQILTEAFEVKDIADGVEVIKQGDEGDFFYIIDSGSCDVFVRTADSDSKNPRGELVMSCKAEDYFGDLALMYNAPRAATVVATSDCRAYQLDRMSFKVMLTTTTTQKREKYTEFLKGCRILGTLKETELMQLADSLEEEKFEAGQVIFKQGDTGEKFYLVKTGSVKISQQLGADADPVEISALTPGNYFGEIALINDRPRQATATSAEAGTVCLQVSQKLFTRVLGPLIDVMKRNMEVYKQFASGMI